MSNSDSITRRFAITAAPSGLRKAVAFALRSVPLHRYHVLIGRRAEWPSAGMWPIRLRDPLPSIPIPLTAGVQEPMIDLQAVLHATYDQGGYGVYVFRGEPDPPLREDDAAWARGFVPG